MLRVVCWKWKPQYPPYRSSFGAEQVNVFRNMVERHYHGPHEVVCITDDPEGIDERVRIIPLWSTWRSVQSPHGDGWPSCYARLCAFDRGMRSMLGCEGTSGEFISVDLDCVIVNDVTDIWNRPEGFVIWGVKHITAPSGPRPGVPYTPYCGSMFKMIPGARQEVYDDFDPDTSPLLTRKAGLIGSDQAWISYRLGPNEAVWTKDDGVYEWRTELKNRNYRLPPDARIVFFNGAEDPWDQSAHDKAAWIRDHYK